MATIGERFIERLGGVTSERLSEIQRSHERELSRAYETGYYDGNDDPSSGSIAAGGMGYRRQTAGHLRDFTKMTLAQVRETVWTLYQSSLIARRLTHIKRDHIVDRTVAPKSIDENLQLLFDSFWKENKLPKRVSEFALQLSLLGEQCYPAFVRQEDGRVLLGYFDPDHIAEVVTHPHNAMEPWFVVINQGAGRKECYRIIRQDTEYVESDGTVSIANYEGMLVTHEQANIQTWELAKIREFDCKEYAGSVFFLAINGVSNNPRGLPDLTAAADWIDQADETLFALAEREQFAGYFSFDVTLTEADNEIVRERAKQIRNRPPGRGSVNVHNDKEVWELFAPNLGQTGTVATFVALLTFIMGGLGFPVSWYGYGNETNRATLDKQADPTEKSLEHDQGVFKEFLLTILQFVCDQAIIAKSYTPTESKAGLIDILMPEINQQNLNEVISLFGPMIQALVMATEAQFNSKETAMRAWHKILNEFGIQVDSEEEKTAIDDEDIAVAQKTNDQLNQQLNGDGRTEKNLQPDA